LIGRPGRYIAAAGSPAPKIDKRGGLIAGNQVRRSVLWADADYHAPNFRDRLLFRIEIYQLGGDGTVGVRDQPAQDGIGFGDWSMIHPGASDLATGQTPCGIAGRVPPAILRALPKFLVGRNECLIVVVLRVVIDGRRGSLKFSGEMQS
jgi:hypothetical protein